MRSGISFFDPTLYKKTVTRWWPIWTSYLVIWLFVQPVNILMNAVNYGMNGEEFVSYVLESVNYMSGFSIIYGLFAAMAVLSHLYWARSANFFGSLPIRREGQFVTLYTAGLSFIIVPNIIIAALTAVVGTAFGVLDACSVLIWLAAACGEGLFFYTFAVFCGMFAGHILALPAYYVIFNLVFLLITSLVVELFRQFYYGFAGFGTGVENAVRWLTPAWNLGRVRYSHIYSIDIDHLGGLTARWNLVENLYIVAVYAGVAAVLAAAAFFIFKYRRTESAGDAVAVKCMRPVFKYSVSVCAGLLLGYVTSGILGSSTIAYTAVFWAVAGYFVAQMILDKSFRVLKEWVGAVVIAAVFAAAFMMMELDVTGFETRIPETVDIESVEVSNFYSSASLTDSGDYGTFILTDPKDIDRFLTLHRAVIAQNDCEDKTMSAYAEFNIKYHTVKGDVSRSYAFPFDPHDADTPGTIAAALESIYEDRELYWKIYGFDRLEKALASGGMIDEITYEFRNWSGDKDTPEEQYDYFRDGNEIGFISVSEIQAIYEAVKRDFRAGRIGSRHLNVESGAVYRYITIQWIDAKGSRDNFRLFVPVGATDTFGKIMELLPARLEDQGLI